MEIKLMDIGDISLNDKNPRIIKNDKFLKLVDSILWFPRMLFLRPVVLNADKEVLGGNQRYKALRYISNMRDDVILARLSTRKDKNEDEVAEKYDYWQRFKMQPQIPTLLDEDLTEDEKQEFIIKDNLSSGDWEWGSLEIDWDRHLLETYGLELPPEKDKFQKEFERYNDDNCVYPLVPKFDEKHEVFIIVSDSEVDANFLRERLGMQKMKSYKKGQLSKSNIISIKDVIKSLQNSNTES